MPLNLLAPYRYVGETTLERQAIETARTSVSSVGHSSSYWCQQRHRRAARGSLRRYILQIVAAYLSSQTSSRRAPSKMLFVLTISFLTQGRRHEPRSA